MQEHRTYAFPDANDFTEQSGKGEWKDHKSLDDAREEAKRYVALRPKACVRIYKKVVPQKGITELTLVETHGQEPPIDLIDQFLKGKAS